MLGMEDLKHGYLPDRVVLDAINNPGFSGGPFVWSNEMGVQKIGGIITGYHEEQRPVDDGTVGLSGRSYYSINSGFTFATSANVVRRLIESQPFGFAIPRL